MTLRNQRIPESKSLEQLAAEREAELELLLEILTIMEKEEGKNLPEVSPRLISGTFLVPIRIINH